MKTIVIVIIVVAAVFFASHVVQSMDAKTETPMNAKPQKTQSAVFAGGCFWCTESDFEKVAGVVEVISGYTGGRAANPTYEQVSAGGSGHVEAVKVVYDPDQVTYAQLLQVFWRHVDPTDAGGQFVDRGSQYRSVIFYSTDQERNLAEASKQSLAASGRFGKPIATEILPLGEFYPAEDYHQDYYKKNPLRYRYYRHGSGRDQFLEKAWAGDKTEMIADIEGRNEVRHERWNEKRCNERRHCDGENGWRHGIRNDRHRLHPPQRRGTAPATDPHPVQGRPAGRHRAGLQQRILEQPRSPAYTWTSSRASRSSAPRTSSTPGRAGRASPGR